MKRFAFLFFAVMCMWSVDARADYTHEQFDPPVTYYRARLGSSTVDIGWGTTPVEACMAFVSVYAASTGDALNYGSATTTNCSFSRVDNGAVGNVPITSHVLTCHPGDGMSGSLCLHPGDPPPAECSASAGSELYELVTNPPILNYSPEPSYCQDQCRYDYVDSYFFDNGDVENRYETQGALCGSNEFPDPPGGDLSQDPTQPDPEENCYNVIGWVDGQLVCGDKADECEAMGGAYGFVNGQEVCIDQEEDPPECPARTVLTASVGGGHECVPVDSEPPPEEPPCETEGDEDCDGTPDEEDPDKDGDGRPDGDHPYQGDGTCDPTHPGYAACIGNLQNISDTADDKLKAATALEAAAAGDKILNAVKGSLGDGQSGISAPEGLGSAVTSIFGVESLECNDMNFPIAGQVMTFTCADTQPIRVLLGFAFFVLTTISIFNLATQRSPE